MDDRSISAAQEPLADAIVLEMGGVRGEYLVLSESDTRDVVISFLTCLVPLAKLYQREWSREQRMARADYAGGLDALLAELESRLAQPLPLAPTPDEQFISEIGRLREACRVEMLFRPKGGRGVNNMKYSCASNALYLMQRFSRRPISGSAETAYPAITALLYEAVTGERDANCKRAYDWILRSHHRGSRYDSRR